MKNILMLTPIYPADDIEKGSTPVVHYFTKEWVKLGYNVVVMHYVVNFPSFLVFLLRPFFKLISSKEGYAVRSHCVKYREYQLDGVSVCRIPLFKYRPHSRYSEKEILKAVSKTLDYCSKRNFIPDQICAHWVNPSFDIMHRLKGIFKVPTCYVAHDTGKDLLKLYRDEVNSFINETDVIGYRSAHIKELFEKNFNCSEKKNFMCYSGIPEDFLALPQKTKNFDHVLNFIFVGSLIERKYPAEIIPAVKAAYGNEKFTITYIGKGEEQKKIQCYAKKFNCEENICLHGYLDRKKVVEELCKNDVFIMISRKETYGLVYLEAMAAGCIVIASKNEGFDGIIQDGKNGFICNAGDIDNLTMIIKRIKKMSPKDLFLISQNAMKTASLLTDEKVAKNYLASNGL